MTINKLNQRYNKAKGDWLLWRNLYDEAFSYTNPSKNPWPDEQIQGAKKNIGVYDTTAVVASSALVARLHKALIPPGSSWFSIQVGPEILDSDPKKAVLNKQLGLVKSILDRIIDNSNFDLIASELLQDLIIGTGAMMVLENDSDETPFRCKSINLKNVYPEGDSFDEINSVWREICDMRGEDITDFWPKAVVPRSMLEVMKEDAVATFEMREGVLFNRKKNNYRHVVFADGIEDFIMDIEVKSTPWIIFRWAKNSQEIGGRGPVLDAMPTIRSLNVLVEYILTNVALSTSPPWIGASDGVFNPYMFEIAPNKMIPVSRQSMGSLPLQKLDVAGDINTGSLEVNDMRNQIKEMLFDNPISQGTDPNQTATLTMLQHQSWLEKIGPAWGRMTNEFLPKFIKRAIFIAQKRGLIDSKFKIDGRIVTISYKSAIQKGRDFEEIQKFEQFMQILGSTLGPQLSLSAINLPLLPEWLATKLDVDSALIKTPLEITEAIQKTMQAQQPPDPAASQPDAQQPAVNAAQEQQVNPAQAQQPQPQGPTQP